MFVQASQLHMQRRTNHHHNHKRTQASNKLLETTSRLVAAQQNDLAFKTKFTGNKQRVAQNDESEIIEYRKNRTFPVTSSLKEAQKTLFLSNHCKQVATRSRSLECHLISQFQSQQAAVVNETAQDLDCSQIGNFCSRRKEKPEYSPSAQSRQHINTRPLKLFNDESLSYSSISSISRDYKSEFKVDCKDYNIISRYHTKGERFHKNLMGEGIREETCPAPSTSRSDSEAFYYKSLSRLIGYLLFIGRLLKRHLQFRAATYSSSKGYLLLVPSFCVNFITYQLETWVHLVRSDNVLGEYEFNEQLLLLLNSIRCEFCSRRATDAKQRNLNKLAWRKRGNQFNKSVNEMYSAAARLSRSTNRAADHRLAHLNDRLSIDQQFSDKWSKTQRQSEQAASGVTVYVRSLHNKKHLSSSSDRSTLDYDSPNLSSSLASNTKSKQQQVGPGQSFADKGVIVDRPTNSQRDSRTSPKSHNPSGNPIETKEFITRYALNNNSYNTSNSLPFKSSLPTSIETINKRPSNRFVNCKPQLDFVKDDYDVNQNSEYSRVKDPLTVALEAKSDSNWMGSGSGSSVISQSIQHNYLIGDRQNELECSEHVNQGKFFYLVDDNPSGLTLDDNSFDSHKDNFVGCGARSVNSDSEIHSTANYRRFIGLQRQHQSEPPVISATREPYQLAMSPINLQIDRKLNKPLQQVDDGPNREFRPRSNASFESKTKSTSSNSGKKSSSYSKLSLAGAKKRLGLKQKGLNSISVQRSEEVIPFEVKRFVRQITAASLTDSGNESFTNQSDRNLSGNSLMTKLPAGFVSGLGEGQIASRQALVSPYLGDIQLSLSDQKGLLEVEVVRASRLLARTNLKTLPSPFVKVYLIKHKKCLAKFKTRPIKETLNPLYQEKFTFQQDYTDCFLQVIVWGDYGRKAERKSLMGIVQIRLNDLDVSNLLIGWYQLFNASSIVSSLLPSGAIRQTTMAKSMKW